MAAHWVEFADFGPAGQFHHGIFLLRRGARHMNCLVWRVGDAIVGRDRHTGWMDACLDGWRSITRV